MREALKEELKRIKISWTIPKSKRHVNDSLDFPLLVKSIRRSAKNVGVSWSKFFEFSTYDLIDSRLCKVRLKNSHLSASNSSLLQILIDFPYKLLLTHFSIGKHRKKNLLKILFTASVCLISFEKKLEFELIKNCAIQVGRYSKWKIQNAEWKIPDNTAISAMALSTNQFVAWVMTCMHSVSDHMCVFNWFWI